MTSLRLLLITSCLTIGLLGVLSTTAPAEDTTDIVLKPGQFPPPGSGKYLAGELVLVDVANRRGGIRLDGDGKERYQSGPLHYFAMLPYGMIDYHGAPAELRDIPIGTHLHGYFYLPPEGETDTIPPQPKDMEKYDLKHNHAVSLEDDFSYYQRRGQSWRIESIDVNKGKMNVTPVGQPVKDGISTAYLFDIDDTTRIWKGRTLADLTDIKPGQVVQLNLGWAPGWRDKEFSVAELWLDEDGRKFATDAQRRKHLKHQRIRWVPGWIDSVEDNDFGGGTMTLTLFGGLDPTLYAELKATQDKGFGVAVAEKTLRTWYHRGDKKIGQVLEWKESPNPPPGSSGIQIHMKFAELLDGYRPGRCVRVKCDSWLFITVPTEERLKTLEEQKRGAVFSLP